MKIYVSKRPGEDMRLICLHLLFQLTLDCSICHRCLTNIANGDHKQTGSVLCAVPYMIEILSSNSTTRRDSTELLEQICWAIGNIAGDCDEYRNVLISNGCLPAVIAFLESSVSDNTRSSGLCTAAQTAAWALSNLSRGKVLGQIFLETGAQ